MKGWQLALLAAGAFSAYQYNKTGKWPWEIGLSSLFGYSKWTVAVTANSAASPQNVYTASSEAEARQLAAQAKASCPTCSVYIAGPDGESAGFVGA